MTEKVTTAFDALVGELSTLETTMTKAIEKGDEVDDEKIEAARADGAESQDEGEVGRTEMVAKDVKKGKASGKKPPLAKSMTVQMEDGTEVEAVDGTELVKALTEELGALSAKFDENETVMAKAMGQAVSLLKALSTGFEKLQARVEAMANEGRGRKAVVSLTERQPSAAAKAAGGETALAKAAGGDGIDLNEFMAKAEEQWRAGKIGGQDLCVIEAALNNGMAASINPQLVKKVMAA